MSRKYVANEWELDNNLDKHTTLNGCLERSARVVSILMLKEASARNRAPAYPRNYTVTVPGIKTDVTIPVDKFSYESVMSAHAFAAEGGHSAAMHVCADALDDSQKRYFDGVDRFISLQRPEFGHEVASSMEDALHGRLHQRMVGEEPSVYSLGAQIDEVAPFSVMALNAWAAHHATNAKMPLLSRRYTDDLLSILPNQPHKYIDVVKNDRERSKLLMSIGALSLAASMNYVGIKALDEESFMQKKRLRHRARRQGVAAYKILYAPA